MRERIVANITEQALCTSSEAAGTMIRKCSRNTACHLTELRQLSRIIMSRFRRRITVALSALCLVPASYSYAELTPGEFRRLHDELEPSADEPWRTIPWKIGLLDAQRTAAKEKKPIFIWAMDGHPLGCT